MHAVIFVRRLAVGAVELVRRIRHVAVRRPLVGLPGPPPAQGLVGVVKALTDYGEALVSGLVESALRLRVPQLVLFCDQLLDLVQHRLIVHTASIESDDAQRSYVAIARSERLVSSPTNPTITPAHAASRPRSQPLITSDRRPSIT